VGSDETMKTNNGGARSVAHVSPRQQLKVQRESGKPLASDALPLPVGLTNKIFMVLFFSASYYLMRRWRDKIRTSTPLHMLNLGEIAALILQVASFIYLIGFFGIDYVQNYINKSSDGPWDLDDVRQNIPAKCQAADETTRIPRPAVQLRGKSLGDNADADIASAVSDGTVPSYSLESELGDCARAASIRRQAVELTTGRSLDGLPLTGIDYASILGQCCEMVVGYVQIPVGVAGPLLLDGFEFTVPMATTEGCLVASTNRGCKAIYQSGGATSVLLKEGMTRAPVVRFATAKRAAELKFYLEDETNFETLAVIFNRTSRFARLQDIFCVLAGRNAYLRFTSSTGDAMGMNMISKGVQNVLSYIQHLFPDMESISVSGNFCADKKATAVNWVEGRGKSVVCEAVLKGEIVSKVLKTSVSALVELNMVKNLAGSALAGALGGFNAHASNIVSAIFIATGQDPAQNVESSHCITMMEAVNGGQDLHVSVTMPSIEVTI
jgi:hydroxymethylglutaryl-CoA reductase (NADPH)